MLSKRHLLFTLLFIMLGYIPLLAQDDGDDYPYPPFRSEEYSDFVSSKKQDQQDKFLDRKYNFPSRPKDKIEVGISIGPLLVSGDVKTGLGSHGWSASGNFSPKIGIGGHVRKSLGYVFSLRGNFMMGSTWGRNWQWTRGWSESSINFDPYFIPNKSLAGSAYYDDYNEDFKTPNYVNANGVGRNVFYNYKTKIKELSVSGIFNLHNIRFHKRQTCLDLYGLVGVGGLAYRTFQDQLDANGNEYSHEDLAHVVFFEDRGDRLDQLNEMYDGTFESQAERHFDDWPKAEGIFAKHTYKTTGHVGMGLAFKVSRLFNLALESRVTYTNDDLLDGQRWQEWGALTRDYDTYVYTGIMANFNIGGQNSVEPLWWMNPMDYTYQELAEAPCCDDLPPWPDLNDDDGDGVANIFDEEPDSREGCPVDTKGRMLDSDRDGVLDCDDECPHTPFDRIEDIEANGCAPEIVAEPIRLSCGDLEGDICDCARKCYTPLPDTVIIERTVVEKTETIVEQPIVKTEIIKEIVKEVPVQVPAPPPPPPPAPKPAPRPVYDPCANIVLPNILFDLNRYGVKAEFEPQLAEVARILRDCPNTTVCVIGHTDVRSGNAYNDVLSYKRAKEVVDRLVNDYGVSRSQLVIQYRGEIDPVVGGLSPIAAQKGIDADHALNRRVEFRVCPPGMDMPMPDGPANAGKRVPVPMP